MDSKTILINSENRSTGTTSDFTFIIPNDANEPYTHCLVLGANIPVSYYLVQAPYNTFILREDSVDTVVTIPEGNYNVSSFQDVVVPLMNAASPNLRTYTIDFHDDYTSQVSGLYYFKVTPIEGTSALVFDPMSEIHARFGFARGSTNVFGVDGRLVSANVVNFIPETVLSIYSNLCQDRNLLTIFHDNVAPYSNISYQCQTEMFAKRLSNEAKDSIYHFTLLSKSGTNINLNGLPILINLLLYRSDDSYKQDIKNYIRYKLLSNK